jgi:hypothetical protein
VPKLSIIKIRKYLFITHYDIGEFELNRKADAAEALDRILESLHKFVPNCGSLNGGSCFAHSSFRLVRGTQEICGCRDKGPVGWLDQDYFKERVSSRDILKCLDRGEQGGLIKAMRLNFMQINKGRCVKKNNDEDIKKGLNHQS